MQAWRNSQPTDDLLEIPGIGPAAVKKLGEAMIDAERITNTYMLFGKYLSLKGPDLDGHKVDIVEHNERFWHYLKIRGISAHRSAIVKAVAEKAATLFPSLYDANIYEDDSDDE
ncbi:predicted protein [Phaeodactylum tricornutum CCAP 1055/1]|jgi:hypothetical protein|uniref:Uncharacterized protein n=3 Tax=Phaeodactylum tricornutum TaxID=2850 RepID=B7FRC9_PHATC|nr:predicted protein [Phaeodactylum tricornutum CCAP 1055/1]EEC51480.1 predicted protein [Phaeodactylum tricornutum CCAP 1055/1]|eukprot:XP_002177017.1 predicted protein [Phaeodactylum tricornutum CCAP 1055/1]